jgi:hypothetical protein
MSIPMNEDTRTSSAIHLDMDPIERFDSADEDSTASPSLSASRKARQPPPIPPQPTQHYTAQTQLNASKITTRPRMPSGAIDLTADDVLGSASLDPKLHSHHYLSEYVYDAGLAAPDGLTMTFPPAAEVDEENALQSALALDSKLSHDRNALLADVPVDISPAASSPVSAESGTAAAAATTTDSPSKVRFRHHTDRAHARNGVPKRHGMYTIPAAGYGDEREWFGHHKDSLEERNRRVTLARSLNPSKAMDDSLGGFYFAQFLEQFVVHLCVPFSIPFVYLFRGSQVLRNQYFLSGIYSVMQVVWSLGFWVLPVLFIIMEVEEGGTSGSKKNVSPIEFVVPMFLFCVHRLMIGVKYGFTDPAVYRKLYTGPFDIQQLELMGGWVMLPDRVLEREIDSACERLGIRLAQVQFHVRNTQDEIRTFLDKASCDMHVSERSPTLLRLCSKALLCRLVRVATDFIVAGEDRSRMVSNLLAAVLAVLPGTVRVAEGGRFFGNGDSYETTLVAFSMFLSFSFFGVLVRFIHAGVVHYQRLANVLQFLDALVDPSRSRNRARASARYMEDIERIRHSLPQVDLTVNENILAWMCARQIFQSFGLVFKKRIHVYMSCAFVFVALMVLFMFIDLFNKSINAISTIIVLYAVVIVCVHLAAASWYGRMANDQYDVHRSTVFRTQFAIRELIADTELDYRDKFQLLTDVDVNQLKQCDLLLSSVTELLVVERLYNNLNLLGLDSGGLLRSLIGLAGSGLTIGYRLLTM